MKAETTQASFQPIKITLTAKSEVLALMEVLGALPDNYNGTKWITGRLYDLINNIIPEELRIEHLESPDLDIKDWINKEIK